MSVDVEVSSGETLSLASSSAFLEVFHMLAIDAGGKLVVVSPTCSFAECLVNAGTISNSGNITINSAAGSDGIYNSGTLTNSGNLTIRESAVTGDGIYNIGKITNTNSGVMILENSGDETLGIFNSGTMTNYGNVTADNPNGSGGVLNLASITNYGYVSTKSASEFGVENGASGYPAKFTDYGTISNSVGSSDPFDNYYGVLNLECGYVVTGKAISSGIINTYACGPVFLSILSSLSSLSLGSVSSNFETLQNDLQGNFTNLSNGISTLTSDLSADYTSISKTLTSISGNLSALQTTVSNGFASLSSSLASDFGSLSSAISNIGRTGPTVGTSNDATVVTSPSFSTHTSFSTSASSWTQVASPAAFDQVVSGYSVSTTSFTRNAVLYISLTNSPGSARSTYAIPLGALTLLSASPSGQLRFPFRIPAGSAVYVEVVSSTSVTVSVQLQFESLPINP
jgi:hypothetical protein